MVRTLPDTRQFQRWALISVGVVVVALTGACSLDDQPEPTSVEATIAPIEPSPTGSGSVPPLAAATGTQPSPTGTSTPSLTVPPAASFPMGCDTGAMNELCVTTSAGRLPENCSMEDVYDLFGRIADAFGQGDTELFSDFFPRESSGGDVWSVSRLQWFSMSGWDGVKSETIYEPNKIADVVTRRHKQSERWEFWDIVVRRGSRPNTIGMTISLVRSAHDLRERLVLGKAEFNCGSGIFYVWATGDG